MNKKITQKNDFKKSHTFNKTKSKQNIIQSAQYSQNGGANPGPDWFKNIFGFNEITTLNSNKQLNYNEHLTITTKEEIIDTANPLFSLFTTKPKAKVKVEKHTLTCKASGVKDIFKEQYIGMFDRPSVGDLETCIANEKKTNDFANLKKLGGLTFQHILTTDVALLHCDPTNAGAVFQVASQFNCLEMIDPDKTPNNGVTIYYNDRTQGPACAMACPAALVYRNYFVKNGDQEGQLNVQINNLEDIGKLLENNNDTLWKMQNGYVIIDNEATLEQITAKISSVRNEIVINALRVGVHWSTSVVDNSNQKLMDHQVCQVYASALPVSRTYNPIITIINKWTDFATCILDGSYRATLCIAALIALKSQKRIKCYLTCIGGGAFGNKPLWIINAIKKALDAYADFPIDVMLVHHNTYPDKYKAELKDIGENIPHQPLIANMPEQCGSSKFDIDAFLGIIPDNKKTIKELFHPTTNNKMNLYAIKGSVVDFKGDVMVNAANERCTGGGGIDYAVNISGGELLINARNALPIIIKPDVRCPTGQAKTTIGGNLKTCLCIHAVGPDYNSYVKTEWPNADLLLYSAYFNSMKEAYHHGCTNIAFCLLSSSLFRGNGIKDRGLDNVISIGILAVLEFANIFGDVVDVFFYGYNDDEYNTLVKIFKTEYNELIKSINNAKIRKFTNAQTKTDRNYNTLQMAYEGLAKGTEAGEATQEQIEIFTKFKSRLDNYKPTNPNYKDYGQIIDEAFKYNETYTDYKIRNKRIEILIDTLGKFETETTKYYELAKKNMLKWCKKVTPRDPKGLEVIVVERDWGEMALQCTKKYGSIFACLNMANSRKPGGGYEHGAAAQEENMFRRTNCHFSIDQNMLILNEQKTSYGYTPEMQALISAKKGITYLAYHPRICIKDKETYDEDDVDLKNFGYTDLSNDNIFLFYELRCAAAYLDIKNGAKFEKEEMRKRIEAQFTTLKINGIRHAIMSAFGCGAFHNPPNEVAELYKECLERYKNDFDVIAFPIYYAGYGPNNYPDFRQILLNNPADEKTNSIFYNGEASGALTPASGALAPASGALAATGIHAVVNPKVDTPAARIAAIAANAANKKKHKNKKDTIGKDANVTAETHEALIDKAANVKAETHEALIDKAANVKAANVKAANVDAEGNELRQAGSKDLAQVVTATNGNISAANGNVSVANGNDSATNGTPSPSFDISPEGSNGQGMLIGFLILCTLGIGAVSFIK